MKELQTFLNLNKVYTVSEFDIVIKQVRPFFRFTPQKNHIKYFNVPISFDIETTSFFQQSEKVAIMYEWSFCIYGLVIIGRTWDEFLDLLCLLISELNLNMEKRIIIYVHNLSFEFAFMRKWLEWEKVFSIKNRTPIYALTTNGIEFRCSYLLSGYNLETIGNNLKDYSIKKLVGDLDYSLIRHSKTPLTDKEIQYCVNDVKIVVAYIAERIDYDGGLMNIPLTKTGYVRKYCKMNCFYENGVYSRESKKHDAYRRIINSLRLVPEEYFQLKRAFQGGFTHSNPFFVNKVVYDVTSFDFTSSYPCVMVAEKFPMGSGELINNMSYEEFRYNLKHYCCVFEIELFNIRPKIFFENYLSKSRCRELIKCQVSNGRIVSADHLKTTITEQDYIIMRKFYTWDESKTKIASFRRYHKGYLPTDFIKAILKLYEDKTKLKGVAGKETEYNKAKEMLNSCYGMTVTDIIRDDIIYIDNLWPKEGYRKDEKEPKKNYDAEIAKYNNNRGRFLFYAWGVYVTAYARRNLFSGILEFGTDYIYSDTDSIKVRNIQNHMKYIENYNNKIRYQLMQAMVYHKLPIDLIEPKTSEGLLKPLGVWDFDGHYKKFKTIGAKRYMIEYSSDVRNKGNINKISLTVSGLNKKVAMPYINSVSSNPFSFFKDGMYIPAGFTGKMTHTYIDDMKEGVLIDYMGNKGHYLELSSVHLMNSDYKLSLSNEFISYFLDIQSD